MPSIVFGIACLQRKSGGSASMKCTLDYSPQLCDISSAGCLQPDDQPLP